LCFGFLVLRVLLEIPKYIKSIIKWQ
jgi:hypothetical protein